MIIATDDPRAVAVTEAIHTGNGDRLRGLLREHPELATCAFGLTDGRGGACGMSRSILHVATDWPGNFPNGAETVRILVGAGADVEARFAGGHHTETPLHWAASSDDVAVLDALLDAGADIEARGAVVGGGTVLSDATAFGNWAAARRLLDRGAATTFWEAATLGLRDLVDSYFPNGSGPADVEVTEAFWGACHGGRLEMARYLHERGADIDWIGWDDLSPLDAARRSDAVDVAEWLMNIGARSAVEVRGRPEDA